MASYLTVFCCSLLTVPISHFLQVLLVKLQSHRLLVLALRAKIHGQGHSDLFLSCEARLEEDVNVGFGDSPSFTIVDEAPAFFEFQWDNDHGMETVVNLVDQLLDFEVFFIAHHPCEDGPSETLLVPILVIVYSSWQLLESVTYLKLEIYFVSAEYIVLQEVFLLLLKGLGVMFLYLGLDGLIYDYLAWVSRLSPVQRALDLPLK